ncbi:hypothetical protein [Thermoflavimicrobium daqui]|uniref:Uncharacterized protein n=1 Tax=Thermoflavimicrobium daqui TaxID=2137476 RepID=A0A364K3R8_9BACL|nr:hypothetical protein [Thermoflavimicrobium daqui]RAL23366.1 hypothetical protein DL897_11795 [Thermoflavimicrobium daqui]
MWKRKPPYILMIFLAIVVIWIWYKYDKNTPSLPDSSTVAEPEEFKPIAKIKVATEEIEKIKSQSIEFASVYFSYDQEQSEKYRRKSNSFLHSQFIDHRVDELKEINQPNKVGVNTVLEQPKKVEILTSYVQGENICVFIDISQEITLQYQDGKTKQTNDSYNRLIVWEKEKGTWKVRRIEAQAFMEAD